MKVTGLILATLGLVTFAQASKHYTLRCAQEEMGIRWPSYESHSEYFVCPRVGGKKMTISCKPGEVFTFVLQMCTGPSQYIPAPAAELLPTASKHDHHVAHPPIVSGMKPPVFEIPSMIPHHPPSMTVDVPKPPVVLVDEPKHEHEHPHNHHHEESEGEVEPSKPMVKPIVPMPPTPAPTPPMVDPAVASESSKKPMGKKPTVDKKKPAAGKPSKTEKKKPTSEKAAKKTPNSSKKPAPAKKSPKAPAKKSPKAPAKKSPKAPTKA